MASTISAGITTTTALSYSADTSGVLQLQTNGGTTAVTIDTSQNVGIGTSSPTQPLTVGNTSTVRGQVYVQSPAGSSPTLTLDYTAQSGGHKYVLYSGGSNTGSFDIYDATAAAYRATIDSSGNFIIQNGELQVNSTGSSSIDCYPATNSPVNFINRNGGGYNFYCGSGLPIRLAVSGAGIVTMSAYGAGTATFNSSGVISSSDGRFKTKTRQVENALASVMALQPTYYRWNDGCPFHTEYEELGFIAQEVGAIIPEASPEPEEAPVLDGDGKILTAKYKNFHDRAIIAVLVKAIQELSAQVTTLQTQVTALKG